MRFLFSIFSEILVLIIKLEFTGYLIYSVLFIQIVCFECLVFVGLFFNISKLAINL